jgi:hypothetical protein
MRRNTLVRFIVIIAISAGAAACDEGDAISAIYAHAWVTSDCGPADGPATLVYLTDSEADSLTYAGAHLSLSIWQAASAINSRPIEIGAPTAWAQRCDSAGSCEDVENGWIQFDTVGSGQPARGEFRLQFGAETITGRFNAKWLDRQVFCG